MSPSTTPQLIKAAKKDHRCDWCNTKIDAGESYKRYRWFDSGDAYTVKMHPECLDASTDLMQIDGESLQDGWGDFKRGCYCDSQCERCADKP